MTSISNKTMINRNPTNHPVFIPVYFSLNWDKAPPSEFYSHGKGSFKKGRNEMENNVKYRTSLVTTLFDRERGLGRSKIENRRGKGADSVKRRDQTRNKSALLCRNANRRALFTLVEDEAGRLPLNHFATKLSNIAIHCWLNNEGTDLAPLLLSSKKELNFKLKIVIGIIAKLKIKITIACR